MKQREVREGELGQLVICVKDTTGGKLFNSAVKLFESAVKFRPFVGL